MAKRKRGAPKPGRSRTKARGGDRRFKGRGRKPGPKVGSHNRRRG